MKRSTLFIVLAILIAFVTVGRIILYVIAPEVNSSSSPVLGFVLGFIMSGCSLFLGFDMRRKEKSGGNKK
ncbi:hypothetical protein AAIR98_001652 [Elusimicrobium simillimum]|uniref:hypothetical protein n=1 Tax=Elusimicrobium simillimum TaxID=3143438 RepID=UPI003C6F21DD